MNTLFRKASSHPLPVPARPGLLLLGLTLLLVSCSPEYGSGSVFGGVESALRGVFIVIGLALAVAGFAIHEFLIKVIGFIAGGLAGAVLGALLNGQGDAGPIILGFIIGGVAGVALAMLMACVTIFLSGFFVGAIFFGAVSYGVSGSEPNLAVAFIGGIVGGLIMFALYRFWITAMTAALGAILFGLGIGASPLLWLLFLVLGIIIQYGLASATGKAERVKPGYTPTRPVQTPGPAYSASVTSGGGHSIASNMPPPPPANDKFCSSCGKRIPIEARVCPYCNKPQ